MIRRMIGVCLFKENVYDEILEDKQATYQGAAVVLIVVLGTALGVIMEFSFLVATSMQSFWIFSWIGILFWLAWASIAHVIGTKVFPSEDTKSNWGDMLRLGGFAMTPLVLVVFNFIPIVGTILITIGYIWFFSVAVTSVDKVLSYSSKWKSASIVAIALLFTWVPSIILKAVMLSTSI